MELPALPDPQTHAGERVSENNEPSEGGKKKASQGLDGFLSAIQGDKEAVLKEQLGSIEEEIVERRLIGADTALAVEEEVTDINSKILNLSPAHENAPDVERKERMEVEKEKLELTRELRDEQRDSWKDVQNLKKEEREIEKELTDAEKRQKRMQELL